MRLGGCDGSGGKAGTGEGVGGLKGDGSKGRGGCGNGGEGGGGDGALTTSVATTVTDVCGSLRMAMLLPIHTTAMVRMDVAAIFSEASSALS